MSTSFQNHSVVELNDKGLTLYGHQIDNSPNRIKVIHALNNFKYRISPVIDGIKNRSRLIYDDIGLIAMEDLALNIVYHVSILFKFPDWRRVNEDDPKNLFDGLIKIRTAVFRPPIQRSLAEELEKNRQLKDKKFSFTTSGGAVHGLHISFSLNEAKIPEDPELRALRKKVSEDELKRNDL